MKTIRSLDILKMRRIKLLPFHRLNVLTFILIASTLITMYLLSPTEKLKVLKSHWDGIRGGRNSSQDAARKSEEMSKDLKLTVKQPCGLDQDDVGIRKTSRSKEKVSDEHSQEGSRDESKHKSASTESPRTTATTVKPKTINKKPKTTTAKPKTTTVKPKTTLSNQETSTKKPNTRACFVPKLDPFDKEVMKHIWKINPPDCHLKAHGSLKDGVLSVKASGVRHAHYRYILRPAGDDFSIQLSSIFPINPKKPNRVRVKQGLLGCLTSNAGKVIGFKVSDAKNTVTWLEEVECGFQQFFATSEKGRIQELEGGKCMDVNVNCTSNCSIQLSTKCDQKSSRFEFEKDGIIRHVRTKECLYMSTRPEEKKTVSLSLTNCPNASRWEFLDLPTSDLDTKIKVNDDYLELVLILDKTLHKEYPISVTEKPDVAKRANAVTAKPKLRYNVAMILLDSLSASNAQRSMPKMFKMLKDDENTVLLKGHTIVGDGTTAQLCAILAGQLEENLPEARRNRKEAKQVDNWPFIFKKFKEKGYVTFFNEDESFFACFNYRLKGFQNPPTDHYARPFWLLAGQQEYKGYCLGNRLIHQVNLNYTRSFYNSYKNIPKFSLSVFSTGFHNNLNYPTLGDSCLVNFIEEMKSAGHLDNTILFIFGDHGLRSSGFRSTVLGKLEERLPFISISLPKQLTKEHPEFKTALQHNSEGLTSQFDIHATLHHMLAYPEKHAVAIGQSLFTEINEENRTCSSAGVKDIWCPCLQFSAVNVTAANVTDAAKAVVAFINDVIISGTAVAKERCSVLKLTEVKRAGKRMPSATVQRFKGTRRDSKCDECGVVLGDLQNEEIDFEVVFEVEPSKGVFEAKVSKRKDKWIVDEEIQRLNLYGDQPKCVQKEYPNLRKFCYCK